MRMVFLGLNVTNNTEMRRILKLNYRKFIYVRTLSNKNLTISVSPRYDKNVQFSKKCL